MDKKLTDNQGRSLNKGDTVKLQTIPLELLLGLTETEQEVLRAEIGNNYLIQGSDRHGKIKLEFYDTNDMLHTILVDASCVTRIIK
jgi:hypothetical protein